MNRPFENGVISTRERELRCLVCGRETDVGAACIVTNRESRLKVMVHLECTPGRTQAESGAWAKWMEKLRQVVKPEARP